MTAERTAKLGKRIPLIGRAHEVDQLKTYLRAPGGGRHFVYYWAQGGLGKTRLLEELQRMVNEAGPRFYFSGIIDLYHTDAHSTSDLERIIVEGLDPQKHYFSDYRGKRGEYELLRERGTDPGILEEHRKELGALFVKGCKEMALKADKLVICFDTIELLQYESSIVEEKARLDIADTRVKPWLLEKLAQLANVLVVFVGRPKLPAPDEQSDPQARLVADMQQAFGDDFTIVNLQPFSLEETQAFLKFFEDAAEQELLSAKYSKIVHRLTGGRPIFLHLIVDWLSVLALESGTILQLFDNYMDLESVDEADLRLETARREIERGILDALFNNSGEIGGYLTNVALMPKGVDANILNVTLGLPSDEAAQLLADLEPLSFIKHYKSPPGIAPVRGEHIFLHDEVYRLLTARDVIPYLRMNERRIANTLVRNYYTPCITELENRLSKSGDEERLPLREQLQKLQVERVYYLLVTSPRQGYEEYKRLTDYANRHRWVGFGMRLLDEFLRFYNDATLGRHRLFEEIGIPRDQIIRESAEMWVERFDWWGQPEKVIKLADQIFKDPVAFSIQCPDDAPICSNQDLAMMSNIYAFWTSSHAKLSGYNPVIVERAQSMLKRLPNLADSTMEQSLAHARLSTTVGYQYRLGGMLDQATAYYIEAKAAFRKLGEQLRHYEEEYAQLLNNLAFVYAKQGQMGLAQPLIHEALRRNESRGSIYHTGLTLSTLCLIARMRGNNAQALDYGEEALKLFRDLGDARGVALSYQGIAQAERQMAKHELEKGRNLEKAYQKLEEARRTLEKALQVAEEAGIGSLTPELHAELGRVYRDLGRITNQTKGFEEAAKHYHQAERQLNSALKSWPRSEAVITEHADALQDLAEVSFALGDKPATQEYLAQVETIIGQEYLIILDKQLPKAGLSVQYFSPLGKVEMLRGQLALAEGTLEDYVQHFVMAYAYFMHFSANATEMATMLEYLYNHLFDEPVPRQQVLMDTVRTWIASHDFGVDVGPFVQALESLLGV